MATLILPFRILALAIWASFQVEAEICPRSIETPLFLSL